MKFYSGGAKLPIKTVLVTVRLDTVTWTASAAGKYYSVVPVTGFTSENVILSIMLGDWYSIHADDMLIPFVTGLSGVPALGIMSNANTFPQNAGMNFEIFYY